LILVGLAAWRLSVSHVSITFLTPYIERALTPEDQVFATRIRDIVLTFEDGDFDVRALDVSAIDGHGSVIAAAPQVSVRLSSRALLQGQLAPMFIDIRGARLHLVRDSDSRIEFGLGTKALWDITLFSKIASALLAAPDGSGRMGYLSRLSITNADLTFEDVAHGALWETRAVVGLQRDISGIVGNLSVGIPTDGARNQVKAVATYTRAEGLKVKVNLDDVNPSSLVREIHSLTLLAGVRLPLSGTATLEFDGISRLDTVNFAFTGGRGRVELPAPISHGYTIERARLVGRYGAQALHIDQLFASDGTAEAKVSGLVLPGGEGGLQITLDAKATNVPVDDFERLWPPALRPPVRKWLIEHLSDGSVQEARAKLALSSNRGISELELRSLFSEIRASDVTVNYLKSMPNVHQVSAAAACDHARCIVNVTGGQSGGLRLESGALHFIGFDQPDQFVKIALTIHGPIHAALRIIAHEPLGFTNVLGVDFDSIEGQSRTHLILGFKLKETLHPDEIEVDVQSKLDGLAGKDTWLGLGVTKGNLNLTLDRKRMDLRGTAYVAGKPAELIWITYFSPHSPLKSRFSAKGQIPVATLERRGIYLQPYVEGTLAGEVRGTQDREGSGTVEGRIDLSQTQLELSVLDWFKPAGAPGFAALTLRLRNGQVHDLSRLKVSAGDFKLSAKATWRKRSRGFSQALATPIDINVESLHIGASRLTGLLSLQAGGLIKIDAKAKRLDMISLLKGTARKAGELRQPVRAILKVDKLLYGPDRPLAEKVTARVSAGPRRAIDIRLMADSLDVTSFIGSFQRGEDKDKTDATSVSLSIMLDIKRVRLARQQRLYDLEGYVRKSGTVLRQVALNGLIGADKSVTVGVTPDKSGGRRVWVTTGDAGAVLKGTDLFASVIRGTLDLTGHIDDAVPGAPFAGQVTLKNYRLTDAPILAKVLQFASLTGIRDVLEGEGIYFDILRADVECKGNMVFIRDLRSHGSVLGLTLKGTINRANGEISSTGTLAPVYMISRAIKLLPLVGPLLIGRDEGLFAATYKVQGRLTDPKIMVNPLTAITPTILRNLLEFVVKSHSPLSTGYPPSASPTVER
jgi:Predicted membrane protein